MYMYIVRIPFLYPERESQPGITTRIKPSLLELEFSGAEPVSYSLVLVMIIKQFHICIATSLATNHLHKTENLNICVIF